MRDDSGLKLSSPIFVTGYMHSGTTLAQKVIGKNGAVFVGGGESRHFTHLWVLRRRYADLKDGDVLREYITYLLQVICTGYGRVNFKGQRDPIEVITTCGLTSDDIDALVLQAGNEPDHAMLLGTAYDYLTRRAGMRRWVDKSPGYVMILDQILDLYPDAKIVVLVRDPRDILASKLRRTKKKGSYDPIWDTLSWRSAVRAAEAVRRQNPDNVLCVRYEDLVSEPLQAIEQICEFLDLEFEDEMLSVGWINTSIDGLKGPGIGTTAIGKWVGELPEQDVFICQRLAKKEMAEYSYTPNAFSPSVSLALPLLAARSAGEFFVRLYNYWVLGGKDHLVNRLMDYQKRYSALSKTNRADR